MWTCRLVRIRFSSLARITDSHSRNVHGCLQIWYTGGTQFPGPHMTSGLLVVHQQLATNREPGDMLLRVPQEGFSMPGSLGDEFDLLLGRVLYGLAAIEQRKVLPSAPQRC